MVSFGDTGGCFLSSLKAGRKVLVVEAHSVCGGCAPWQQGNSKGFLVLGEIGVAKENALKCGKNQ